MPTFFGTSTELSGFNPNCDWFAKAKYGISTSYQYFNVNNTERIYSQGKYTDWDTCVKEFDVERYAKTLADMGAGYALFVLYSCEEYICVPSHLYDSLLGAKPGAFSATRDLAMELADALEKYNIPLMLYITADGPWKNAEVMTKLCDAPFPANPSEFKPHHWNATFKKNWFAIAREWSLRYGKRVAGWWVDGADPCKAYTDAELMLFRENLLAGNPDAIMCFNPGNDRLPPWRYSIADDFTAGESGDFDDYPEGRWVDGVQWHEISYVEALEKRCERDGTDPATELGNYLNAVAAKQGVVTVDLRVFRDGSVLPQHVDIMKKVKAAVRG
ncbi:MAG: alpha-L-fucosidase [Clostridia bacterium]|nr:alpha-L-fucosidase [Clostridia bacterium]